MLFKVYIYIYSDLVQKWFIFHYVSTALSLWIYSHSDQVASILNILDDELVQNVGDYILRLVQFFKRHSMDSINYLRVHNLSSLYLIIHE